MKKLARSMIRPAWLQAFCVKIHKDVTGQDMIEYSLMAAAVALASAAVLPTANSSISIVFSKVGSVLVTAAGS